MCSNCVFTGKPLPQRFYPSSKSTGSIYVYICIYIYKRSYQCFVLTAICNVSVSQIERLEEERMELKQRIRALAKDKGQKKAFYVFFLL